MRNCNRLATTSSAFAVALLLATGCASKGDVSILRAELEETKKEQREFKTTIRNLEKNQTPAADPTARLDELATRLEGIENAQRTLAERVAALDSAMATLRTDMAAASRPNTELESIRAELRASADQRVAQLTGELAVVRADATAQREEAIRMARAVRSSLERQRLVMLEQYKAIEGMVTSYDQILEPENAAGGSTLAAPAVFAQAVEKHKAAVDQNSVELYQAVLDLYRRALELDPSNAMGHYNAAVILLHLARPADARVHLQKYIDLEPAGAQATQVRSLLADMK